MRPLPRMIVLSTLLIVAAGCPQAGNLPAGVDAAALATLVRWNQIAVDASGLDHMPVQPGETRRAFEQPGPTKSSRAMAIVHIAMFDAANAVLGGFESYAGVDSVSKSTSTVAAVAQAARDTLVALFPSQAGAFDAALAQQLAGVSSGSSKDNGIALGATAAAAILALREGDGASIVETFDFSDDPGYWRVDPINPTQNSLGHEWSHVGTFVLNSAVQFRAPPPPAMTSPEYTAAFNEVKALGGDGVVTPTSRTEEQSQIGIYWAYDGTPSLCAPPRLYNQIAVQIAQEQGVDVMELARLLALVNVAMADAGIALWDSKYYHSCWRPVCGIREADVGTGISGLGDGNAATVGDPNWMPLGAPLSNRTGPNFTPPFPAYPSGHAGFGGALFETLRNFFETDDISFTFVSDELNGETVDNTGNVRPLVPRSFTSFSQAEEENGQSRIYLGIHWAFDKTEGITMGRKVADHVFENAFQPVSR